MALRYKKVPLEIIIDEAFTDLQLDSEERNLPLLKRWATDIYNECYTPEQLIHKISLGETDSLGKMKLPTDFKVLDQVSYRIKQDRHDCTSKIRIKEWVQKTYDDCEIKVEINCDVCHKADCTCNGKQVEVDVDHIFLKQNPWYTNPTKMGVPRNSTEDLNNRSYLTDKFTLMGYKGNSYHRLKYHVDNCENLSCIGCKYSYSIEDGYLLTDTPPNTEILFSYFGQPVDENGDVYLLDQPDLLEAIKKGILEKHFAIKMLHSQDSTGFSKYRYFHESLKGESQLAMNRAISKLGSPDPHEWRAFLSDVWVKRIRNDSRTNTVIHSRRK